MLYGTLRQYHPDYASDVWSEIELLYEGGFPLLAHASKFLPKLGAETEPVYRERLRDASYINYFGRIVDYFVAALFTQEIVVTPAADAENVDTPGELPSDDGFYPSFARDCDRRGMPFQRLMRDVLTSALKKRSALVAIDLPRSSGAAVTSRADEEAQGTLRAYAFEVPVEQVLDWEYDDDGSFAWVVLHRHVCKRASVAETRNGHCDEFKVWTRDKTGVVSWDLYRTEVHPDGKEPNADYDVPRVDGDVTTFKRIPLVEMVLPPGLWVGNKLGCMAREHFSRRSALISAENKSLFAALVAFLGPEVSAVGEAMPAEAQQNPNRASTGGMSARDAMMAAGIKTLGADDKMAFVEPSGKAYEIVDKQLDRLVDEMFRVTDQMAASIASTSQALGRSGQSKAQDQGATEIVLGALGAHVRDLARRVYQTISEVRGEDVIWTPHGLDKYELDDRESLVKEATTLGSISIPSVTFRRQYMTKLAFALLGNVPPETQEAIRQEIVDGVQAETDLAAAAKDEPDGDEEHDGDEGKPGPGDGDGDEKNEPGKAQAQ